MGKVDRRVSYAMVYPGEMRGYHLINKELSVSWRELTGITRIVRADVCGPASPANSVT